MPVSLVLALRLLAGPSFDVPLEVPLPTPTVSPAPEPSPEPEDELETWPDPTPPPPAATLKISGTIWPTYRYDLSAAAEDHNQFDVSRAYLIVQPSLSNAIDGRLTLEVVPQAAGPDGETSNTTGSLVVRLKHGFIAWRAATPLELTVGMLPTPWIAYEEDVWGYRILGETGAGAFFDVRPADIGAGARVRSPGGRVELHAQVQNGETYAQRETNKYKEFAGRIAVQVLPHANGGLKIGGYHSHSLRDRDLEKVRTIGMVSWQSRLGTAMAGWVRAQDVRIDLLSGRPDRIHGDGPFAAGHLNLPLAVPLENVTGTRLVARVDYADPDRETNEDGIMRTMAGIAFLAGEKSQVIFNVQRTSFQDPLTDPRTAGFVHWDLRF